MLQVGILMQRAKASKVYFQQESGTAYETLLSLVRQQLPVGKEGKLQEQVVKEQMKEFKKQTDKNKPDKVSFNVSFCGFVWV